MHVQKQLWFCALVIYSLFLKVNSADDCPTNWEHYKSKCYYAQEFKMMASDKNIDECRARKATAVAILSEDENEYLSSKVLKSGVPYCLGLQHIRMSNPDFQWEDGSPFMYSKWENGKPSSLFRYCFAAHIYNGLWQDTSCFKPCHLFCQRELNAPQDLESSTSYSERQPIESNANVMDMVSRIERKFDSVYASQQQHQQTDFNLDNIEETIKESVKDTLEKGFLSLGSKLEKLEKQKREELPIDRFDARLERLEQSISDNNEYQKSFVSGKLEKILETLIEKQKRQDLQLESILNENKHLRLQIEELTQKTLNFKSLVAAVETQLDATLDKRLSEFQEKLAHQQSVDAKDIRTTIFGYNKHILDSLGGFHSTNQEKNTIVEKQFEKLEHLVQSSKCNFSTFEKEMKNMELLYKSCPCDTLVTSQENVIKMIKDLQADVGNVSQLDKDIWISFRNASLLQELHKSQSANGSKRPNDDRRSTSFDITPSNLHSLENLTEAVAEKCLDSAVKQQSTDLVALIKEKERDLRQTALETLVNFEIKIQNIFKDELQCYLKLQTNSWSQFIQDYERTLAKRDQNTTVFRAMIMEEINKLLNMSQQYSSTQEEIRKGQKAEDILRQQVLLSTEQCRQGCQTALENFALKVTSAVPPKTVANQTEAFSTKAELLRIGLEMEALTSVASNLVVQLSRVCEIPVGRSFQNNFVNNTKPFPIVLSELMKLAENTSSMCSNVQKEIDHHMEIQTSQGSHIQEIKNITTKILVNLQSGNEVMNGSVISLKDQGLYLNAILLALIWISLMIIMILSTMSICLSRGTSKKKSQCA